MGGPFRSHPLSFPTCAGFFYTRLAFYAYKGYAGYSFDDIPDVD